MSRIIAIGDVHGQFHMLRSLVEHLEKEYPGIQIVLLGDYIDRGEKVKEVLDFVINMTKKGHVALKGNHEDMLCNVLAQHDNFWVKQLWLDNGGVSTMKSYGITERFFENDIRDYMDKDHINFIFNLPWKYETDKYLFVHGGIDPELSLHHQDEETCLWIRGKFLNNEKKHPKKIVVGHTPFKAPLIRENYIAIDTGAFAGNKLTAILLPEEKIIQVDNSGKLVTENGE